MISARTIAVAACLTALNVLKPLSVDDYASIAVGRQVAAHPTDPFGFTFFWGETPLPANGHLLHPLVAYFLAPAIALFPATVWLWKLWLFPFALILCGALHALLRRFARGLEDQVLLLVVFSPAVLPAFNLMLDIPALALNLLAVAIFLFACDRRSLGWAIAAGIVGGLGAQAKYPALAAFPAILLCAAVRRFPWGGALASIAGGLTFASWELFLIARYGQSMLASTVGNKESMFLSAPWVATLGTMGLIGGLAPGLPALALLARGAGNAAMGGLIAANILVPVVMLCAPDTWFRALEARGMSLPHSPPELVLFLPLGLIAIASCVRAWKGSVSPRAAPGEEGGWEGIFLTGWLLIEVAACVAMTPFLAARRLIALTTVMTVLTAHVASRAGVRPARAGLAVMLSLCCGAWVWAIDTASLRDTELTVERIARRLPSRGADIVWYAGHWSFQYYAEAQGWQPIVPGKSVFKPGDWLVLPTRMSRQPVAVPKETVETAWVLDDEPLLPLSTIPFFYVTSVPYGRLFGPQVPGAIQRVLRHVTAEGDLEN